MDLGLFLGPSLLFLLQPLSLGLNVGYLFVDLTSMILLTQFEQLDLLNNTGPETFALVDYLLTPVLHGHVLDLDVEILHYSTTSLHFIFL